MMSMRRMIADLRSQGLPLEEVRGSWYLNNVIVFVTQHPPLFVIALWQQMQKRLQQVKESASSPISQADFLDALRKVNPSVGKADLDRFQLWMNEFGSA
jgi:hypothetical protein